MSKLCQYCGAEMDNEAYECPECLKRIPGAEMIIKQRAAEKKEKKKKIIKTTLIAVGSVAFITALTLLVTFMTRKESDKFMKPVKSYIDGCVKNDYAMYVGAFHPYYQEMFNQSFAYIILGEMPEETEKMYTADLLYLDEYYRELARQYGTNFDITYKIYEETHIDESKLLEYRDEFVSYDQEKLEDTVIDDGYEITVVFTVKGNLGSRLFTEQNFQILHIDGEWYMMSYVDFLEEEETDETTVNSMY